MAEQTVENEESAEMSVQDQKGLILSILLDFLEDSEKFFSFVDHVGFDLSALSHLDQLPAAWVAQYRLKTGEYDVDRACLDLATWPPIASEIVRRMDARERTKRKSSN